MALQVGPGAGVHPAAVWRAWADAGLDEAQLQARTDWPIDVIRTIHTRSPNARVLVVDYAAILPETGFGCWPQVPLAWADVPYLRAKEKELTHARDALAALCRRMPRMAVEKEYRFEGPDGPASLIDLFEGRRQLIVYRFFFEPGVADYPEGGCRGCSFLADQVAHLAHLNARGTTLAFVSRAPQADIQRWKARMGWEMPWYTLTDDFDADFGVDEWHGTNVFYRDGDRVFRTYFINNRGDEQMGGTWNYLDITPLGRQEAWEDSPEGYPQTPPYTWWNWHDSYVAGAAPDKKWVEVSDAADEALRKQGART